MVKLDIQPNIKKNIEKQSKNIPNVQDLNISNYQDMIIIAMKREEKAYKLYIDLAKKNTDNEIKEFISKISLRRSNAQITF